MTNTASGRSIDPRFDPAFQPGYDPQADPVRAARVPSYDAMVDSPRLQPGRVVEPPRAQYEPETVVPTSSPRATDAHAPAAAPGFGSTEDEVVDRTFQLTRNPFLIALWVAGATFVLAGVALIGLIKNLNDALATSTSSGADYIYLQVAVYCVPGAFTLGFGTIIGLLFFHARGWGSRG